MSSRPKEEGRQEQVLAGLGMIMDDPDTRAWLMNLLLNSGMFTGLGDGSEGEHSHTWYAGRQALGQQVNMEALLHHPEQWATMLAEYAQEGGSSE